MAPAATHISTSREREVLHAAVEEYIDSGEPVASRTLNKKTIALSPALIRSVMARLEGAGYLRQPHISAGRIPTNRGYRVYVDELMTPAQLSIEQRLGVSASFEADVGGYVARMQTAARVLATTTGLVGFAIYAPLADEVHRHIEFIWLRRHEVLAIVATRGGRVYHRTIRVDVDISQAELQRFQNYLNARFEGMTLRQIRDFVVAELEAVKVQYKSLHTRALLLSQNALPKPEDGPEVILDGHHNLLKCPEFASSGSARLVLEELEHRNVWISLMNGAIEDVGVNVVIGPENAIKGLEHCTVVSTNVTGNDGQRGGIGVVGPTRLAYGTIIAVIDWVRSQVGNTVTDPMETPP